MFEVGTAVSPIVFDSPLPLHVRLSVFGKAFVKEAKSFVACLVGIVTKTPEPKLAREFPSLAAGDSFVEFQFHQPTSFIFAGCPDDRPVDFRHILRHLMHRFGFGFGFGSFHRRPPLLRLQLRR